MTLLQDKDTQGVPLAEAAARLGISEELVRKRIYRKKLKGYKVDGRWHVVLNGQDQRHATPQDSRQDPSGQVQDRQDSFARELIDSQKTEIEFLRSELSARTEELRRKDHIIAALTDTLKQRLPELEPGTPATPSPRQSTQQERSWWQRFFGWF